MMTLTMMETAIPSVATMLPLSVSGSTPAAFYAIMAQGMRRLLMLPETKAMYVPATPTIGK